MFPFTIATSVGYLFYKSIRRDVDSGRPSPVLHGTEYAVRCPIHNGMTPLIYRRPVSLLSTLFPNGYLLIRINTILVYQRKLTGMPINGVNLDGSSLWGEGPSFLGKEPCYLLEHFGDLQAGTFGFVFKPGQTTTI